MLALLLLCLRFCGLAGEPTVRQCGTVPSARVTRTAARAGGIYLTSRGTLRVLLVFASFPDDETPNPWWPAHQAPLYMHQFIDPDTTTRSDAPFSLTAYFRSMSLDQFHLVGEAVWVETLHSRDEYANGSYARANTAVLQERVDSLVDFSQYDAWTNSAPFTNDNVPDGQVDMIVMVWRTSIFPFVGEASLGHGAAIVADGKRIEMGYPGNYAVPLGSGVTCEYLYSDDPAKAMHTMAHELGHWLLGAPHPYNGTKEAGKHSYWGILCDGHRISSCANAYEREMLGWITLPEIPGDTVIALQDYVTTGAACKYHPPNGEESEYFYFENHQRRSVFDDATANTSDRGIWILHQQGPYSELDNLRVRASDGDWHWETPGDTSSSLPQVPPVFVRGMPQVGPGLSNRDMIPTPRNAVNWMSAYQDQAGLLSVGAFYAGELFQGALNTQDSPPDSDGSGPNSVFSSCSNPSSHTWDNTPSGFSLEIIGAENGVLTLRSSSDLLSLSPARRYLGIDPTVPAHEPGRLALAWGSQWAEGQALESGVNWSELESRGGSFGSWTPVYQGPATSIAGLPSDSRGTVFYRARVRTSQGKFSSWSNVFRETFQTTSVPAGGSAGTIGSKAALEVNYPNPFNPSTLIRFELPHSSGVRLSIYDILGRCVRNLVDGHRSAGMHAVVWDGTDNLGQKVPSGVYMYRLSAGSSTAVRKMILTR